METFKTNPTIISFITRIDLIVFTAVIIVTIVAVLWGNYLKEKSNSEDAGFLDHLLMGRQLTLPMFIATLVATWYGGIFGVTAIAFEKGIYNFITQGFFWYITYIIFALFLVKKIKSMDSITLPEIVGKIYGPKSQKISALFNFFNVVPIAYAVSLGLFLQSIFGGSVELMTLIGVAFVVAYSIKGGFRSVVFSDLVQFVVMCTSVMLILFFSVYKFGGLEFLKTHLPERHFSLTGGESLWTTFAWGLIALSTLVDPNFYQRCFAAYSVKVAKKGILISTVIWVVFDICTTSGAMYAAAVIPKADPKIAYLSYGIQILPDGLRGFVLAGILATILSTIDSYIFTAGTTLTYDIGPRKYARNPNSHHLSIIFVGLLAVMMASFFEGDIKSIWKTLGSYSAACLLFPVLIGYVIPNKLNDYDFIWASIIGAVATTYWRLSEHSSFWQDIDELYIGILATAIILFIRLALKFKKGRNENIVLENNNDI
ncbi:MAG: sodium:solute symporter family protein [Bdellovibrionota bacterium]